MGTAPAGWYVDEFGRRRYWDGAAWTDHAFEHSTVPAPVVGRAPVTYAVVQPSFATPPTGPKSFVTTWLLAWLLGFLALDRFYLGRLNDFARG